jgi:hypothetical protein
MAVKGFNNYLSHDKKTITFQSPHTGKCYTGTGTQVQVDISETHNHKSNMENAAQNNPVQSEINTFQKAANEVWDSYRQLYYQTEHSVGSVFCKAKGTPVGEGTTAVPSSLILDCFFAISKYDEKEGARWESVHLVTISPPNLAEKTCDYKIDSAVWCTLKQSQGDTFDRINEDNLKSKSHECPATTSLSATLVKETTRTCKLLGILPANLKETGVPSACHIENLGGILEQIEIDFRSQLERVVLPKAVEVMPSIYRVPGKSATVHLVEDGGRDIENKGGTGMGVGKDMIGDIADSARSKDSDKVLETVAASTKSNATSSSHNVVIDMRASLKSPTKTPRSPTKSSAVDRATPEFINFRDKLKSPKK